MSAGWFSMARVVTPPNILTTDCNLNLMIKKRTVLILGAGASAHLGYPSSSALRQRIIENLSQESGQQHRELQKFDFLGADIDAFVSQFRHSGMFSIDAFLEHQSEKIKQIGKYAIAQALILFENLDGLFPIPAQQIEANWYYALFKSMLSPFDAFMNRTASGGEG